MRLLVTGAGRSGTHWMAQALRESGLDANHECAFTPSRDARDGDWLAEMSWPAAAYLPMRDDVYVVHLVRHPLDVVSSILLRETFRHGGGGWGGWGAWAMRKCPEIVRQHGEVERAAAYWVQWNRLVEPHAHERVRLQDADSETVTRLARIVHDRAHIRYLPPPMDPSRSVSKPVSWDDVSEIPGLVDMARRYGFS